MSIVLKTTNLSKSFGGVKAVSNANVNVKERELKAIIGPNGAGKTTFYNVLTGFFPATSGEIYFMDRNITKLPIHDIVKQGICRTFQINTLFIGATVFENVRIASQIKNGGSYKILSTRGSLKTVNDKTWATLEKVGLTDKAKSFANELSYGDQRSLEVGIALAGEPKVLLLDEPTAGMSDGETKRIASLIRELTDDITVVLVEHDVDMVMSISDSISVMNQGEIIAEGTPDEIRQNELVKKAYLGER
jgi:branched-chain amino acid transport system ATP-binding protein